MLISIYYDAIDGDYLLAKPDIHRPNLHDLWWTASLNDIPSELNSCRSLHNELEKYPNTIHLATVEYSTFPDSLYQTHPELFI